MSKYEVTFELHLEGDDEIFVSETLMKYLLGCVEHDDLSGFDIEEVSDD